TAGSIRLFDVRTGEVRREFRGGEQLRGLAISPDGRTLAAAIRKEIKLWDVGTGELKRTLRGHENWVLSIAFSADGKALVSGGSDGTRLWALAGDK
ncbi:MAG TPA: WD40 repeat domain-containing protein, partial [Gemmataceae bacterium]|nr:WD40 repeat domain-containing protein [Gemmataceae bacterium]